MKGTVIENSKLTKVIDGDTIKILFSDKEESIRNLHAGTFFVGC